jgi:hypothetical protein
LKLIFSIKGCTTFESGTLLAALLPQAALERNDVMLLRLRLLACCCCG